MLESQRQLAKEVEATAYFFAQNKWYDVSGALWYFMPYIPRLNSRTSALKARDILSDAERVVENHAFQNKDRVRGIVEKFYSILEELDSE